MMKLKIETFELDQYREAIEAVRDGNADWAQAVEVRALAHMLRKEASSLVDLAIAQQAKREREVHDAAMAGLRVRCRPRIEYDAENDVVTPRRPAHD